MEEKDKTGSLKRESVLETVAAVIVKSRYVLFALFAAAAVFCVLCMDKVKVDNDLTSLLPAESETRRGIAVMEEEFSTYASLKLMIPGVPFDRAQDLAGQLRGVQHVADVSFDETSDHYKNGAALFGISFDGEKDDPGVQEARAKIEEIVKPFEHYTAGDQDGAKHLAGEMGLVMLFAALVILVVLLFTSHSYFEIVIFGVVFVFAALLNMGTNFLLGTISFVTSIVAVILQLALAIDYAIIFAHRFEEESLREADFREALTKALSKSMVEIASSSLTTIAGLAAMTLMQFRLGYDLGVVLIKGILCSMLTVFLLMPGLILLFPKLLKKTAHRSFVPDISAWGRLLTKRVPVFLILFGMVIPGAVWLSARVPYGFSDGSVSEIIPIESRAAARKIESVFGKSTGVAILVPGGDYEKEKTVLEKAAAINGVTSAVGIANIEVRDGVTLTDPVTAQMIIGEFGIDAEKANMLFHYYGFEHGTPGVTEVPLIDLAAYLLDKADKGLVPLTNEQQGMLDQLRPSLERAVGQLKGNNWDRLVLSVDLPAEGEESRALVDSVRAIAEEQYGKDKVLVIGEITSASDLRASYQGDSLLISILTVVFVFVILLFTFRSPVSAAILVFVIQGSIWINFAITYLEGSSPSFVTNMIVSSIQMGATVDYAIVMMSRYRALRERYDKREAMVRAIKEGFPTVITSGLIMTAAGLLIAFRVSDVYAGHIGLAVGRGAAISVILVLSVLPQLIVLCDKAIEKTTLRRSRKGKREEDPNALPG